MFSTGGKVMSVSPIPEGFSTVSIHIVVKNSVEAMAFYEKAFGAKMIMRMPGPDGESTVHGEVKVGDSTLMLADENPQWHLKSPESVGGRSVSIHLYVEDADALFKQAVDAGCTVSMPMMDAFWGDRYGKVLDPFGYEWSIATHKEDVSEEELAKRAAAMFSDAG